MATAGAPRSNQDICLATLRETDRDRYLACLLSPEDRRRPLTALYAFSAELARIRDLVHEPLPGEVRLQYWRDLLEGQSRGSTEANPIAAELIAAIETYRLPRVTLVNMIDARVFDLYDDPMENRNALEGYAGETASALIQLASLVLSPAKAVQSAVAAGHAGVAQAIAGSLLLMPLHRRRGQLYLPLDILSAVGLDRNGFLEGKDTGRIEAAIDAFSGLGLEHLGKARAVGKLPPEVVPAFLPVALSGAILRQAQRQGAQILERFPQPPQWGRQLRLALAAMRGKI